MGLVGRVPCPVISPCELALSAPTDRMPNGRRCQCQVSHLSEPSNLNRLFSFMRAISRGVPKGRRIAGERLVISRTKMAIGRRKISSHDTRNTEKNLSWKTAGRYVNPRNDQAAL